MCSTVYETGSFLKMNIRVSIILLLVTPYASSSELRVLQSVFRHADRYPLAYGTTKNFYPLNPYANATWFPDLEGGLTMEGKRRSYELGNALRVRYGEWFGYSYSRRIAQFRSNNNDRCTATAALVAAGLFSPNNGSQMWNPSLNWQPIPITSIRYPENLLFYGCILCTKYEALLAKTKHEDPEIVAYDNKMKQIYDYVSRNTGAPANNRILFYLYMELQALVSGGLSPPSWSKDIFSNGTLEAGAIMEYKYSSWNDELKRLTGGVWIKRWLEHVDDYISNASTKNSSKTHKTEGNEKAFFYSGHDINVAGIMNTLGIFYPHVPNYASVINLELHEDDEQRFFVKVAHRDSENFVELMIPACENILCPLDTFRKIFANILEFDTVEECGPLGIV